VGGKGGGSDPKGVVVQTGKETNPVEACGKNRVCLQSTARGKRTDRQRNHVQRRNVYLERSTMDRGSAQKTAEKTSGLMKGELRLSVHRGTLCVRRGSEAPGTGRCRGLTKGGGDRARPFISAKNGVMCSGRASKIRWPEAKKNEADRSSQSTKPTARCSEHTLETCLITKKKPSRSIQE